MIRGLVPIWVVLSIIVTASQQSSVAQGHIPVFPELEGELLIQSMRDAYSPTEYLTYSDARDTLFAKVYARDDSLAGIFTDHTLYLDPNLDPTQAVFMNGLPDGINTEHIWPQSKGAGEPPARMDMHNLYPARVQVNSDRASLPFLEVDDVSALEWYYRNQSMSQIPGSNIDLYSERSETSFEPRESVKGNVARTMFYFRVIYEEHADIPFFELQRETLCDWHLADPADSLEWAQNQLKAQHQGTPNPFILDCSTVRRAFCPALPPCTVAFEPPTTITGPPVLYPNPTSGNARLDFKSDQSLKYTVRLIEPGGKTLYNSEWMEGMGEIGHFIPLEEYGPGLYFVQLVIISDDRRYVRRFKLVHSRD